MRLDDLSWVTRFDSKASDTRDGLVADSVVHMSVPVQGTKEALHCLLRSIEKDPLVADRVEGEFDLLGPAFPDAAEGGEFHLLSLHISEEAPLRVVIDHHPLVAGHCPVCRKLARGLKITIKRHPPLKAAKKLPEIEQLPYPPAPGLTRPGDLLVYLEGDDLDEHLEGVLPREPDAGSGMWSVPLGAMIEGFVCKDTDGLTVRSVSTMSRKGQTVRACVGMDPRYFQHSLWGALEIPKLG